MITKELMVAILAMLGTAGWVSANYLNSILRAISDIDKHHTNGMKELANSLNAHVIEYKHERELSQLRFDALTSGLKEENRKQTADIREIQGYLEKTSDFTVRLKE